MTTYIASGGYTCNACNMGFSSTALLAKHRSRFCIGDSGDVLLIKNCRNCESRCRCESSPERSKYNPNKDPKLHSLAENHGKQMEFLSNRNKDLERQRDEIRRRLGELGKKPANGDNTADLLAELRDQEARNQRLLDELKKQLLASRQPVAIIGEQQQQVQQKKCYTYPVYYGNSLVAEISAIRQAYIQSGGDDCEILAQLAQMLAEAQAIEEAMRNKKPPEPKKKEKKVEITSHVMTLDLENERLNHELRLLREQNLMARNRRKDDREVRPITVINYPSPRCDHRPVRSRIDEIIITDNNVTTNTNDMGDSGDCQICSAYFTHMPFSSPAAMDSPPYPQYNPYPYPYPYPYPQQQPAMSGDPQNTARATTVAPSAEPPVAASSVDHSHTLHVPSMPRQPTAAGNDATSVPDTTKDQKSHRSHKSHKSHS